MNDDLRAELSSAYFKLLSGIDWDDKLLVAGIQEGLNKFLSNAVLSAGKTQKYRQGDYVSAKAKRKIEANDHSGLVYEHMVPKQRYIQEPCVKHAKATLTEEIIGDLLIRYWKIAIVTQEEAAYLHPTKMPDDWDDKDVRARYVKARIDLIPIAK